MSETTEGVQADRIIEALNERLKKAQDDVDNITKDRNAYVELMMSEVKELRAVNADLRKDNEDLHERISSFLRRSRKLREENESLRTHSEHKGTFLTTIEVTPEMRDGKPFCPGCDDGCDLCTTIDPAAWEEHLVENVLEKPEAEVDSELRSMGVDPKALGDRAVAFVASIKTKENSPHVMVHKTLWSQTLEASTKLKKIVDALKEFHSCIHPDSGPVFIRTVQDILEEK